MSAPRPGRPGDTRRRRLPGGCSAGPVEDARASPHAPRMPAGVLGRSAETIASVYPFSAAPMRAEQQRIPEGWLWARSGTVPRHDTSARATFPAGRPALYGIDSITLCISALGSGGVAESV